MLIKYDQKIVNLNLIKFFDKGGYYVESEYIDDRILMFCIDFEPDQEVYLCRFHFKYEEDRDEAFEKIIEDYKSDKNVCDLDLLFYMKNKADRNVY